jgi:Flp pilus assembly CpaE family ATPase
MAEEHQERLQSAFNEDSNAVIIKKSANPEKFFQFMVSSENPTLDFPVIPSNGNTVEEVETIRNTVSDAQDVGEKPAGGEGISVILPSETDLVALSEKIIAEIWSSTDSIETETV